ncbi:MAG: AAA family ATPase [Succinimonas sp.]|nr:AAA family ATPase [Succinimonas sp.]
MTELLTYRNFEAGIENFEELRTQKLVYIDKTSYLEDLVQRSKVMLLLRPRRFGKTLSMSMLSCFLEMNYQHPEDRSRPERLFKDLDVYKNKAFCNEYMGRYPVLSITLKSIEGSDFAEAMKEMLSLLLELLNKYAFLQKSSNQEEGNKLSLRSMIKICSRRDFRLGNKDNMDTAIDIAKNAMKLLSDMLYAEYEKEAVIIIDEYDVPLQKAKVNGYYDKMLKVIKGMLGKALKSNNSLAKGYVTGCLRIAHQSIFTDINNFDEFGINDATYSRFIGLSRDEAIKLLCQCGMENRLLDVLEWYDGYNFAGHSMLCPWSVLKFLSRALDEDHDPAAFKPENYWANSSGNDIIEICMKHPRPKDIERFQHLLEGKSEEIALREFTTYPAITSDTDFDTFATLMLHTGYLTVVSDAVPSEKYRAVVKIPNKEVLECFSEKAKTLFSESNPEWLDKACKITAAFFAGEADKASDIIEDMLVSFISIRDTGYEYFYHGFMLGILSMTITNRMSMEYNRESGNGFSDIVIKNSKTGKAVILEFKKCERDTPLETEKVCREALKQIEINHYDQELKKEYPKVLKYGIAFVKKGCQVIKA